MIKVECVSCKSPYDVDERRIPDKGMKMRCPKCNTSFMVARDGVTSAVAASPPVPIAPIAPIAPAPSAPAAVPVARTPLGIAPARAPVDRGPTEPMSPPLPAAGLPSLAAPGAESALQFKKTLMGAGNAAALSNELKALGLPVPAAPPAKPLTIDVPSALADLPALKPAANKPAAPWGSLAPPSMDAKPQPTAARPAAPGVMPKGASGAPPSTTSAVNALAAGIGTLKASAGSAFGTSSQGAVSVKQTMMGAGPAQAARGGAGAGQTAAGSAPNLLEREPPSAAHALDITDLPAPKPASPRFAPQPPAPAIVDLPGVKPPSAAAKPPFAPPPPARAAAPKPAEPPDELPLIDLPGPKVSPKAAVKPHKPANTVELGDLDLDLDLGSEELELGDFGEAARSLPPPSAAEDDAFADLPAPKAAHKAKPAPEAPLIDLPAPRAGGQPAAKGQPAPFQAAPSPKKIDEPGAVDLPAVKGKPVPQFGAALTALDDIDLPGTKPFADLPAPKVIADLPAAKGSGQAKPPASAAIVDLPAPRGLVDLPAPRGELDLPMPKGFADLPTPRGIADLPAPKGVVDLPGLRADVGFGELDLPMPKAGQDEASFGDLELPELPVRPGFGNIELPMPRAGADFVPPKAATFHGVGPFSRQDSANFGDLDLNGPEDSSFSDIREDDFVALKEGGATSTPPALQDHSGGADYGEASLLGDEHDEPMEFGIAEPEEGEENLGLPPELLRRTHQGEVAKAEDAARGKRALHTLIGVAAALVLLGGAGAALGLTDYGFFGIYFWERFLPEAGDARFAREAIERAEKTASSDTYREVQRSLALLGESRRKAGLNRELLTRSLLHESLFSLRFGAHPASTAHAAAILSRLDERHGLAPGMNLARAADAGRRQAFADAERFLELARTEAPQDPYVSLLGGELSLQQNKVAEADKAFAQSLRHGGGARAQWGLARVSLARTDAKVQRSAVEDTLKASPMHAEAHIAEARLLWNSDNQERALSELRRAIGQEPIGDQYLWSSKSAKASGFSLLGYINEQRGHLSNARKAYDDALAADPYMVEALLGAGRVYQRERRWNDALARFESALNLAQKSGTTLVLSGRRADVEARLGQASTQLALNRSPEAKNTLSGLLNDNPNDPEIVRAAGQAEDALGNKLQAEELLRKAVELSPNTFPGYLALAQHYFKTNRADKASETLNEAASKVEENVDMRRMLGQSELARNRVDSAVHEFKRAVELDPQDLDAQFGLAVAYRKSGQLDAAREIFERIAARDSQYAGLALERGQLLEASGQFEKAVELYRGAHAKDASDTQLNLRLGAAQVEAGRLDDAELTLQSVMHELPNSADAEYFSGRLALARGRGPDAITHFDRALSLDGSQAVYHLYTARAALDMANLGRALEEAEAALTREPSLGDGYWIRGVVRMRSGAVKDALKDARRALELNPGRTDAYALMAECFDELRQLPDAAQAYRTAVEKEPTRGEWWYKLGRLSLDMGTRPQASEALDSAMRIGDKMDPRPYWLPDSYRLAGELARSNNDRKRAVSLFLRYLQIAPDGAIDRDEVRKILTGWDVDFSRN